MLSKPYPCDLTKKLILLLGCQKTKEREERTEGGERMRMNQRKESLYLKSMAKNTHRFVIYLLQNVMFRVLREEEALN